MDESCVDDDSYSALRRHRSYLWFFLWRVKEACATRLPPRISAILRDMPERDGLAVRHVRDLRHHAEEQGRRLHSQLCRHRQAGTLRWRVRLRGPRSNRSWTASGLRGSPANHLRSRATSKPRAPPSRSPQRVRFPTTPSAPLLALLAWRRPRLGLRDGRRPGDRARAADLYGLPSVCAAWRGGCARWGLVRAARVGLRLGVVGGPHRSYTPASISLHQEV